MRRMWRRILWWWRRDREEQELDEELRAHMAIETRQRLEAGESPKEAELAARRLFGNQARITEETRDVWRIVWLEQFWQDIQFGLRSLRRTPAVTLTVIATFALGIGVNTALFSIIYTVLLKPLPYQDPDRLLWVSQETTLTPIGPGPERHFSDWLVTTDLLEWQNVRIFDAMAGFRILEETITVNGEVWQRRVTRSSEPLTKILGVAPALGRDFTPEELQPGAAGVALLSHGMFLQRLGGDPSVIGRTIAVSGRPHTIIGVMPPMFRLPLPANGQAQFEADAIVNEPVRPTSPYMTSAIARLKPGDSIESAAARLTAIMKANDEQGHTTSEVIRRDLRIEPLHERIVGGLRFRLVVLWAAVGFVLLVACVNVTNLLLARSAVRARELAIRTALGAGKLRLIRQHLTESSALALAGGVTGALLATVVVRALAGWTPLEIPRLRDAAVDANALAFTFAICVITGIVSGLASAFVASGTRPVDALTDALAKGSPAGSAWRRQLHGALVVSELALAMILAAGAGLMVKSLWQMDSGMKKFDQVFSARFEFAENIRMPQAGQASPAERFALLAQLQDRRNYVAETAELIEALPGVTHAALWVPDGAAPGIQPQGLVRTDGGDPTASEGAVVTPHYFDIAGMRLLAGSRFDELNPVDRPRAWIVNEAYLRPYGLPGPAAAVGMEVAGLSTPPRIVGVVSDFHTQPDEIAPPQIFSLMNAVIGPPVQFGSVWVRSSGDPMTVAGEVRRILGRDGTMIMIGGETLADQMSASIAPRRFQGALLISFAGMALLLALVGTYGVLNYTVAERTQEIGVRMALGAARGDVMRMILRRGVGLAIVGIILGLAGALALSRLLESMVFGVPPTDPWTYAAVCFIMLAVALAAASLPAWRAMRVDPIKALRYE